MVRILDQLFQIHVVITERCPRLRFGCLVSGFQLFGRIDLADASASSGRCLDQHRITDLLRDRGSLLRAIDQLLGAGHHRHIARHHQPSRGLLVSHPGNDLRRRSDEYDPIFLTCPGKLSILRQKTITGVNRVALRPARRLQNDILVQIAVRRLCRSDADRLGRVHDRQ